MTKSPPHASAAETAQWIARQSQPTFIEILNGLHRIFVLALVLISLTSLAVHWPLGYLGLADGKIFQPIGPSSAVVLLLISLALAVQFAQMRPRYDRFLLLLAAAVLLGLWGGVVDSVYVHSEIQWYVSAALTLLTCLYLLRETLPDNGEVILFLFSMGVAMFAMLAWVFTRSFYPSGASAGYTVFSPWSAFSYLVLSWIGTTQSRVFKSFLLDAHRYRSKQIGVIFLIAAPTVVMVLTVFFLSIGAAHMSIVEVLLAQAVACGVAVFAIVALFFYAKQQSMLESVHEQTLTMVNMRLQEALRELECERQSIDALNRQLNDELNVKSHNLDEAVAALKEQRKLEKFALESKSRFLSTISHEIRGPLSAIVGLAGLLKGVNDERSRPLVEKLEMATRHLDELLTDVLEMSKLNAGKMSLREQPFDLKELTDRMIAWVLPVANHKGIYLRLEQNLKAPTWLLGDELRLRQVLLNLVNNAIKFTDNGGVLLRVTCLQAEAESTTVQIQVEDTGKGIAKQRLSSIFDPFEQENLEIGFSHGGHGLGLAIVKDLIDLMRGSIEVNSLVGKGSTFTLTLSFQNANALPTPQATKEGSTDGAAPTLRGKRVLIVDDMGLNRDVVKWLLEAQGCVVHDCDSGQAALDYLSGHPIDLLLTDLYMPGLTGIDLARSVRQNPAWSNVLMFGLSGSNLVEEVQACKEAGMIGLLLKPFDPSKLLEAWAAASPLNLEGPR
ncbi:MAG TPA: ATP-binding protein [Limnobacter sp.]|nr:ATP-binding protein [Limnobacter sp.]